jgi:hypothetical protein
MLPWGEQYVRELEKIIIKSPLDRASNHEKFVAVATRACTKVLDAIKLVAAQIWNPDIVQLGLGKQLRIGFIELSLRIYLSV